MDAMPPVRKWPIGKSEMHERVRAHDWAATPLGPMAEWPPSLKFAVDLTLNAGFPSLLLWGKDLIQIYNDPYLRLCRGLEPPLGSGFLLSWPDSVAHGLPIIERVRCGETVMDEAHYLDPVDDSGSTWLTSSISPVHDESGDIAGISILIDELTQRVLTEMALRERETQLSNLLDLLPVGIALYDVDGEVTKVNPEVLRLFGGAVAHPWQIFDLEGVPLAPDDYPMVRALRGEVVKPEVAMLVEINGKRRWLQIGAVPYFHDGRIDGCIAISHDVTEAKENADRLGALVAELQHRTRNLIAVVSALSDKTIKGSASLDDFQEVFGTRLAALARVQGLLSRLTRGSRVKFDELLRAELEAHSKLDSERITLDGKPGVRLRSHTVQTLALALHELTVNSVKYGALGQPQGRLAVRWRVDAARPGGRPYIHVDWEESGVSMPAVDAAEYGFGYGRELIELALPYQFQAETSFALGTDGVKCMIALEIAGDGEDEPDQTNA
ncbi:MAG TPA: HWE histidine kinase domain-containing protein [Sphingobium sp.]|nr:HWE histidine kinase domain-containing protein [Sphingobium sp.]